MFFFCFFFVFFVFFCFFLWLGVSAFRFGWVMCVANALRNDDTHPLSIFHDFSQPLLWGSRRRTRITYIPTCVPRELSMLSIPFASCTPCLCLHTPNANDSPPSCRCDDASVSSCVHKKHMYQTSHRPFFRLPFSLILHAHKHLPHHGLPAPRCACKCAGACNRR